MAYIPSQVVPPTIIATASSSGILANGSDQTSAINAILANSSVSGLKLDLAAPGAITINGTINGGGKALYFVPGINFTGTGTIDNVVINAGFRQKLFDTTVSLTGSSVANEKFSALWYGVTAGSYEVIFQKAIDTVLANSGKMKILFIPSGGYFCTQGLLVYAWGGTQYNQVSMTIQGESTMWPSSTVGTTLVFTQKNTFGIGIQLGKGCTIKDLKLQGAWTNPAFVTHTFYNTAFAAYTDPTCRDVRYSPYTAILVDPFGSTPPVDGGYPIWNGSGGGTNYYRNTGGAGSTGTTLDNIFMTNWVVGIATSVNGITANAEIQNFKNIQFASLKLCIASSQDQEKLNNITYAACWGPAYRFFSSTDYGQNTPGNWYIDGVNIAGAMVDMISRNSSYYFTLYVRNVFAEALGGIGFWNGTNGDILENCDIDFQSPPAIGAATRWNGTGFLTIKNSQLRYYGTFLKLSFSGIFRFENCYFETIPYVHSDQTDISGYQGNGNTIYVNCVINTTGNILGRTGDRIDFAQNYQANFCYGNYRMVDTNWVWNGIEEVTPIQFRDPIMRMYINPSNLAHTVVVTGNTGVVTPPNVADLARLQVNQMVIWGETDVFGYITSVGASTFTVGYMPDGYASGSFGLQVVVDLRLISFMGSTTAGSPLITNVIQDKGTLSTFISFGGYIKIPGFAGLRDWQGKMQGYNSGTGVITMDRNATTTGSDVYFSTCGFIKSTTVRGLTFFQAQQILQRGQLMSYSDATVGEVQLKVTKSGKFSGSPQAVWYDVSSLPSTVASGVQWVTALAPASGDYTITTANYITLPDLTGQANRNLVLPVVSAGYTILVRNINTSAFTWSFSGGTVKDLAGNTITAMTSPNIYQLTWNGASWDITD